jgi:amino acid adenylation domain-containing protein
MTGHMIQAFTGQSEYDFPGHECEQSLANRFEMWARQAPDRLAFRQNGCDLSYNAINRWSNRLAHALLAQSEDQTEPVVLLLKEPLHHAVAQLGVLKAGKSCVPMDISFPLARQSQILADSRARFVVTEAKHRERAMVLAQGQSHMLTVDEISPDLPIDNPGLSVDPEAMAYVLYTAGSTGRPKGIMQSHRNLLRVTMLYHQDLGVGPADRVTSPTSLAYTGTIWALLSSLMNGAAFVHTSLDSPRTFVASLAREEVTVAQLIVTLLRQLTQALDQTLRLPSLRRVYTGGEPLHKEDVKRFARIFPDDCRLLYNYGSTEAGIITHLPVDLPGARKDRFQQGSGEPAFPVGYPVADTEVLLVDENGIVVPEGNDGEIAVCSRHVSLGYWRDARLTQKQFLPEPAAGPRRIYLTGDLGRIRPDGCLIHLGRKDDQVKVRGYRVNLEEIEEALRSIDGIVGAVCLAAEDRQRKTRIVAFVERKESYDLSIAELRRLLEAAVPSYMIPSLFVHLDRLPVAANGKLDRSALPSPDWSRPELEVPFIEPRTPTEKVLCRLWSEVLNIEPIGALDNFLDLGGDSIAVFRLIGRITNTLDLDMAPRAVFDAPILEEMARAIDAHALLPIKCDTHCEEPPPQSGQTRSGS